MRFHLTHSPHRNALTISRCDISSVLSLSLVLLVLVDYKPETYIPASLRMYSTLAKERTDRVGEAKAFSGVHYLREHSSRPLRYRPRRIIMDHNCINIMLINN